MSWVLAVDEEEECRLDASWLAATSALLLAKIDERAAQVVEMRYFGGLTEPDIAESLGVSERTVRRSWEKAKVLLTVELA